jgi:hypothetical protein
MFPVGKNNPSKFRFIGTELIHTVLNSGDSVDEVGGTIPLNPCHWVGTHVNKQFELKERWQLNRAVVKWCPTIPTSTNGAFAIAVDADPGDEPPESMQELMAQEVSSGGACWQSRKITFIPPVKDWLYCDNDASGLGPRLTSAGKIRYWSGAVGGDNAELGFIQVEYDITVTGHDLVSNVKSMQSMGQLGFAIEDTAHDTAVTTSFTSSDVFPGDYIRAPLLNRWSTDDSGSMARMASNITAGTPLWMKVITRVGSACTAMLYRKLSDLKSDQPVIATAGITGTSADQIDAKEAFYYHTDL